MGTQNVHQTVNDLREWMKITGYSDSYISRYNSTTNQLLKYMDKKGLTEFDTEVGFSFLKTRYYSDVQTGFDKLNTERLRLMQMLSEFQLHGVPLMKQRVRQYDVPEAFKVITEQFIEYRRFEGIIDNNISGIRLYLERFFSYLTAHGIANVTEITVAHIHGYLRFLSGYSNATKDHNMRSVRQFMGFCFRKGYCAADLSPQIPTVHYEKRANIPSVYSEDEVAAIIRQVDRSNPCGKRDYAIMILVARLGIRANDVAHLKFENIYWESNRISFTQHKTGKAVTLTLLEEVGTAIIDYLKFGRPKHDSTVIFLRTRAPIQPFSADGIGLLVSRCISKAGLLSGERKHGSHALRHSLASRLLENNVPLPVISEILGHTNTNTTAAYLSVDVNKLRMCALEV